MSSKGVGKPQSPSSRGNEKDNDDGSTSSKNSNTSDSEYESTKDIVLSLRDPTYLHVLHQYFKKLGSKTNPNNPDFTEATAAQEVFDMFKNKEGKFLKLKNARNFDGGFIEADDDEALDKIRHDMNRRMESAKRWLESKSSKSPTKKEKSPSATPLKKSPSTKDIVLSLRDPTYLHVLHQYFKKLGSKTNPNNPDFTEATAAQEVFDMFKNKEGKFLKLKNARNFDGGFIEADDDEALDKIRHDMNRRMESAKRWLESKSSKSPTKKEKSPSATPLKKSPSTNRKKTISRIILSLTDPTYKEVMHKYFKKMGPKTKSIDVTKPTEAEEAVEVLNEFKGMAGKRKFMKLENWRDPSSDYVEVDDDEAVKKIKIDLTRRMDSTKQWIDPKPKSSATKPKKSPPKRDASPKDDSDDYSDSRKAAPRTLRKKEIPNYANSGENLPSRTAAQVEAERTAKQSLSAKDKKTPNKETPNKDVSKPKLGVYIFDGDRLLHDSSGRETKQRENDIILSLRDSKYRDTLTPYFHELGTEQDKDKNRAAADDVFEMFKEKDARFFKPNGRGKDADCDQVDDSYALQNIYLDIKRRTDSTWWLDENVSASPQKKKSSSVKAKTKKAKPTRNVIVSLSDPDYKKIMEVEFKKLGEKTGPDKREVAAAEEVFNRFKRDGAVFTKLENFRDASSNNFEMDEDEAFRKIRTDMQRRMESAKRWLDGGVNSKSYIDTNKASPRKTSPLVHNVSKKSRLETSKKRELPVQMHRSTPSKKKARTGKSLSGSKVARQSHHQSHRGATESSRRGSKRLASSMNTNSATHRSESALKVTICFGDHVIDTEVDPSLIQPSQNFESFPDRFDPNVRPKVPAYKKQIYIPGNEVYARWLNENDPSSYGTWYSGFVYSSKLAPTNVPGRDMPKLLYHVKFHDGAEGMDLHTEDMMMREQYEAWLRDLEVYYALPELGSAFTTHIPKGARVYAQWNDPTDPKAHGSWLQGTVRGAHDSRRYHVRFDNGDEDDDMSANHVLLDGVYVQLIAEKMRNSRGPVARGNRGPGFASGANGTSGLELITRASQLPSPVRQSLIGNSRETSQNATQRVQKPSSLQFTCEIATEDLALSSNGYLLEELRCDEVFASVTPIARSKTQELHYGIYVNAKKPWVVHMEVDEPPKSNAEREVVSVEELRCEEFLL